MPKCANKIVLYDRTVVSPGKMRYFWDFGWSYLQKLTSTTQNFHFAITFEPIGHFLSSTPFFVFFFDTFSKKSKIWQFWPVFENCDVTFEIDVNYVLTSQKKIHQKFVFSKKFKMQKKPKKWLLNKQKFQGPIGVLIKWCSRLRK